VKRWAEGQDETNFHISVLTLAEYDKGIHNLPDDHPDRPLQGGARCAGGAVRSSVLPLVDAVVRRWSRISGAGKRASGHAPPVIDTLLASTAIEHDLYLVTRDVKDTKPSVRSCSIHGMTMSRSFH
jgi:predicted nucleic acid-binding protein